MGAYSRTFSLNAIAALILKFPLFAYLVGFFEDFVISTIKTGPVPRHVAMIMDGNRTYAKRHRLPLKEGHFAGANALVKILEVCYKIGIEHATVYAFSLENFNRPKEEVDTLFGLLRDKLKLISEYEDSYARYNKVCIRIVGNRSYIPEDILKDLEFIEEVTKTSSTKKVLNVCFPYTARDEITYAIKSIAKKRVAGELQNRDEITTKTIESNFYFGDDVPPLDILIRTSGHTRLSDFLLWQCSTDCTIEFPEALWPDFGFVSIVSILFKWSYYKTLQIEELRMRGKEPQIQDTVVPVLLKELPQPPPIATVS
ncbi:SRT1 [Candida oxycetoniae]|uniref:Alkyl transferase n=1 Tax=Candida oxycetoniae TaxID=497107 RepID=A0AAI9WWG5_9ASCO|nr:SRT1 [Candida oxycetoniae]KAI3402933.1 SRT1 [Candida oxycetoniae]